MTTATTQWTNWDRRSTGPARCPGELVRLHHRRRPDRARPRTSRRRASTRQARPRAFNTFRDQLRGPSVDRAVAGGERRQGRPAHASWRSGSGAAVTDRPASHGWCRSPGPRSITETERHHEHQRGRRRRGPGLRRPGRHCCAGRDRAVLAFAHDPQVRPDRRVDRVRPGAGLEHDGRRQLCRAARSSWILPDTAAAPSKTVVDGRDGFAQFQWEPNPPTASSTPRSARSSRPDYIAGAGQVRDPRSDGRSDVPGLSLGRELHRARRPAGHRHVRPAQQLRLQPGDRPGEDGQSDRRCVVTTAAHRSRTPARSPTRATPRSC